MSQQRVALITGGMGGLGETISTKMADAGYRVAVTYSPSNKGASAWVEQMKSRGYAFRAYACDVADYDSAQKCVEKVSGEVGPVDILVNNAGITRDGLFKRMIPADWYAVINTNLNSVFNVTRQVIEGMTKRGWGRIVNISSVNALKGQFGQTNYSAAKAGMHGFTKALAQEVVKKGVTVNTISPGYVETPMVKAIKPEVLKSIVDQIPMGRLAQPDEIAGLVAYLVSDEAAYVTGSNISINGGLHME